MRHLKTLAVLFVLASSQARADFIFPSTAIASTDPVGASFTLTDGPFSPSSTLTMAGAGIVNLNVNNGPFNVNAAGVVINSGGIYNTPAGGTLSGPGGIPFGALLIGNATLGFFQLFPANAANGLGSGAPPSTVNVSATLASIFGASASSITSGTTLFVKINDVPLFDNAGSFTISGSLTAVPEPASMALLGLGSVMLIGIRLRRRRQAA